MNDEVFVGVDVSKARLDVCFIPQGEHKGFNNTLSGINKLVKALLKLSPTRVVLEATGGYERALVNKLLDSELPCSVANPHKVRQYARSGGKLAKTDKIDALVLANYGKSHMPRLAVRKSPSRVELENLLRRRSQLVTMINMEANHADDEYAYQDEIAEMLELMNLHLSRLEACIAEVIASNEDLRSDDQLLRSIPCVGLVLSATVLAQLPEANTVNRKELAALVGVAPFNCDSGQSRGQRHIYSGRQTVRNVLSMAAVAALRCNGVIKQFYNSLKARGKASKVALVACMRKLLSIMGAILRTRTAWRDVIKMEAAAVLV